MIHLSTPPWGSRGRPTHDARATTTADDDLVQVVVTQREKVTALHQRTHVSSRTAQVLDDGLISHRGEEELEKKGGRRSAVRNEEGGSL